MPQVSFGDKENESVNIQSTHRQSRARAKTVKPTYKESDDDEQDDDNYDDDDQESEDENDYCGHLSKKTRK